MNDLQKYENNTPSFNEEQIQLIKKTVCKGATDDEFRLFMHVCTQMGLDPFMKQIYSIPRGGQRTIQVSIDGYRLIAERTGKYAPGKESLFNVDKDGRLISATAYVKKQTVDGTWHEVSSTVYMCEYMGISPFWKKMPFQMLNKVAESSALRKAFPAELAGTYTNEEMEQADKKNNNSDFEEVEIIKELSLQEKELLLEDYVSEFALEDRISMKDWLKLYCIKTNSSVPKTLEDWKDKDNFNIKFQNYKKKKELEKEMALLKQN